MSREKQIEEITNSLYESDNKGNILICGIEELAEELYNAGYRKQIEAEWQGKKGYAGYGYYCSNCNAVFVGENCEWIAKEHDYCGKCGAKMIHGQLK